jgi:hypothetical protein
MKKIFFITYLVIFGFLMVKAFEKPKISTAKFELNKTIILTNVPDSLMWEESLDSTFTLYGCVHKTSKR